MSGFQLVDLIITELKDHMTPYKFEYSHWWKIYLSKKSFTRFALQSECCNFNQCTEVRFASFLSGGFTTMAVINPPEKKLANHTSVHWLK